MAKYAARTQVPVRKSRDEIERTLSRYGADGFLFGEADGKSTIGFRMGNRHVRFSIHDPDPARHSKAAFDQERRRLWRALAMVIKAKLESVASGVAVFDEEFLAHIVLPDGQTVGQFMVPQIQKSYDDAGMPPLLPDYSQQGPGQ